MACFYHGSIHVLINLTSTESNTIAKKWEEQKIYYKTFFYVLATFILTANLLVIIGILKTRKALHLPQKFFLLSSFCGLVTGLTQPYFAISDYLPEQCLHEAIADAILMTFLNFDFLLLVTIGVFRFISIKSPLTRINGKLVILLLLLEALVASLMATFSYYAFSTIASPLSWFQIYWLAFGSVYFACIFIGSALIMVLVFTLRKQEHKFKEQKTVGKHGKAIKRICLIQLVYVATNLPLAGFCLHFGLYILDPSNLNLTALMTETILAVWLFPLSSGYCAINSIIYMYFSKDIRKFYCGKFKHRIRDSRFSTRRTTAASRRVSVFSQYFFGISQLNTGTTTNFKETAT